MANPTITHRAITGAAANPRVMVDGPKWDDTHVVTGLENVDNTSDVNKPVSTAQAAANAVVAANASAAVAAEAALARSASNLTSGTVPAGRMPALTGDVTTAAGAVATTIAANAVTNAKAAQMAANTIKGNNTGSTANAADLTGAQVEQMLLFTQTGTGAVQQLLDTWVKGRPISVKDFGVVGNGSTDDTTAIQNAVTAAVSSGLELYFPPGNYKISAQINVNGAITISGANSSTTIITLSNLTANGLVITTGNAVKIFNLTIQSASQQTAGTMIQLTASGGENQFSVFRDLVLLNAFIGMDIVAATEYTIDNCYVNATSVGIHIQNTFNADHGDPKIVNNTILQSSTGGGSMGVKWESGGGIKFIGNKINGYAFGFVASQASTGSTTIMLLEGNSIENQGTAAIVFQVASGSPTLNHIVISGNHIAGTPIGVQFPTTTGTWPKNLVITDNVILLSASGTQGIQVLGGTNVIIGHNAIMGGGGTPTGILIGVGVVSGQIGFNTYNSLTTNITNNSAGVTVH